MKETHQQSSCGTGRSRQITELASSFLYKWLVLIQFHQVRCRVAVQRLQIFCREIHMERQDHYRQLRFQWVTRGIKSQPRLVRRRAHCIRQKLTGYQLLWRNGKNSCDTVAKCFDWREVDGSGFLVFGLAERSRPVRKIRT